MCKRNEKRETFNSFFASFLPQGLKVIFSINFFLSWIIYLSIERSVWGNVANECYREEEGWEGINNSWEKKRDDVRIQSRQHEQTWTEWEMQLILISFVFLLNY